MVQQLVRNEATEKKKMTEGNARKFMDNFTIFTALRSQKSEKHAWFEGVWAKKARQPSRPHVLKSDIRWKLSHDHLAGSDEI